MIGLTELFIFDSGRESRAGEALIPPALSLVIPASGRKYQLHQNPVEKYWSEQNEHELIMKKANGDYYYDPEMGKTLRAKALRVPGYEKPVPYHYKLNPGQQPKRLPAFLIWSSRENKESAYEDYQVDYARYGALVDLIDYGKHIGVNFLEGD